MTSLKAPFPWFGGKSRVAHIVWERFGNVDNYIEPFFGSGAVLLGRPTPPKIETVNDLDCMVANFWRAVKNDSKKVAAFADWPVNEADQHARHLWLCSQEKFRETMKTNPNYFDANIAGWWVWGLCIWIGSGWCSVELPHLSNAGRGINRQRPHLSNAGQGINQSRLHLGNAGRSIQIQTYMQKLSERLRDVRVCCGDWKRVVQPAVITGKGIRGVFLDPPYGGNRSQVYNKDSFSLSKFVAAWAIEAGKDPGTRVALCGFEGEHSMPKSWDCVAWKTVGGYGSLGRTTGRENSTRERIWFSPYCLCRRLF